MQNMNKNTISIMQPYIFPYLGYFHLIECSDTVVFYDDVNFIKAGWINRNRILLNGRDFMFTIPLEKPSQNKLINEIGVKIDQKNFDKFFAQIRSAYGKAPYYPEVVEVLKSVFQNDFKDISDLAINSILMVYEYLGKEIKWLKSSTSFADSKGLEKADRLISITKRMNSDTYINLSGGKKLYDKKYFSDNGIQLGFVESKPIQYKQFENDFIPWLSIIDVLMINHKDEVLQYFEQYKIG
jgi:hypothetical protein